MSIVIENINKSFGKIIALDDVSLEIKESERFFLVGPSGCGKTTLLRIIAGLETPDSGRIILNGKEIQNLPVNKRNISMVFQNYALWLHLTVEKNIAFGLGNEKLSRDETAKRVDKVLDLVKMRQFKDRHPDQLSGGEQQRVALARALVVNPGAVLLDEPLSNLDANLRKIMRNVITDIQEETGVAMIYVTHDREEALSMSHHMAVMNHGRIVQVNDPYTIYNYPASEFTADFLSETVTINGTVIGNSNNKYIKIRAEGPEYIQGTGNAITNDSVTAIIRCENIKINSGNADSFKAKVLLKKFLGEICELSAAVNNNIIRIRTAMDFKELPEKDQEVDLYFPPEKVYIFKRQ